MGLYCCGSLCKCILILFNTFFAILGLGMVGLGIALRFGSETSGLFDIDLKTQQFVIFVVVLIVLGSLMLIVSIFGFHGACSENLTSLQIFAVLMGLMAGVEIAAGVVAFMQSDEVSEELVKLYTSIYTQYLNNQDPSLATTLTILHNVFYCCGVLGGIDPLVQDTCPRNGFWEGLKTRPCPIVIKNFFKDNAPLIMGSLIAIAALMIGALVCCGLVIQSIKGIRQELGTTYGVSRIY